MATVWLLYGYCMASPWHHLGNILASSWHFFVRESDEFSVFFKDILVYQKYTLVECKLYRVGHCVSEQSSESFIAVHPFHHGQKCVLHETYCDRCNLRIEIPSLVPFEAQILLAFLWLSRRLSWLVLRNLHCF